MPRFNRGVMANVPDFNIIVSEFELQLILD